jgi:rhodanese-related sulfurtransferase
VGVPELTAEAVMQLELAGVRLVDVREQDEYRGELGHIAGSQLVPLSTVQSAARTWSKQQPIVLICRSGGRSGRAALQLAAAGFERVASLRGGMSNWNARQLPIQSGYIETRQG